MPDTPNTSTTALPGDPFFILKECRELFVRRLTELARQSGVRAPEILEAVGREIGAAHDELAAAEGHGGFDETQGLTASRISLVGNDDLELDIRIGEIANHLRDDKNIDHWHAQLRYMTLLQRRRMAPDENPVGMEPIRRGLRVLCRESSGNLDQHLERLQRLEELLKLRLPEIYLEINQLLDQRGIKPVPVQLVRQAGSAAPSSGSLAGGGASDNPLAALQQTMQRQAGTDIPFAGVSPGAGAAGSGGNFVMDASALVMLNHLIERLDVIERQHVGSARAAAETENEAGGGPALRPLRSGDLDLPAGKPTAIVLDTLSLIFESIFASPDLPDAIKTMLSRLQIPLLKKAILDPDFFSDVKHPARQLINRLARAAVGLPPDTPRDHPLCRSLAELTETARSALESRDGDLAPVLAGLDALIARRDEATREAAQACAGQVRDYERNETALAAAQNWLQKALARTREPAVVHFLSVHWVRVMQDACLAGGVGGEAWKEGESVVNYLLWSILPKRTPEERQKLTALIPALIRKINAGLDGIAVPAEQRQPFLDACFVLQTNALRGRPNEVGAAPPSHAPNAAPAATAVPGTFPPARILEREGKCVQYFGRAALPAVAPRGGPAVAPGDWLSFRMPDDKVWCGMVCWQSEESRTLLLFNPAWNDAVALAPQIVEQQLQAGTARVVSGLSLFDTAAEQALGRLRNDRHEK